MGTGGELRDDFADEIDASVDWSRYVSFASTRRRADSQAVEHLKMLQHHNLAVKADNDRSVVSAVVISYPRFEASNGTSGFHVWAGLIVRIIRWRNLINIYVSRSQTLRWKRGEVSMHVSMF